MRIIKRKDAGIQLESILFNLLQQIQSSSASGCFAVDSLASTMFAV